MSWREIVDNFYSNNFARHLAEYEVDFDTNDIIAEENLKHVSK